MLRTLTNGLFYLVASSDASDKTTTQAQKLLTQLETSLGQCEELVAAISIELEKKVETGKLILMESDLREELAYKCLLEGIDLALNHLLVRYYPNLNAEEGKWERAVAKYLELGEQIRRFRLQKVCV